MLVQTFQPDARPSPTPPATTSPASSPASSSGGEALGYPPFRHLVRIVVSGPDPQAPLARARGAARRARRRSELLGPAPLLRLRGRHRAQLVAKTERPRAVARQAAALLASAAPAMRRAGLTAVVDVDPQSL